MWLGNAQRVVARNQEEGRRTKVLAAELSHGVTHVAGPSGMPYGSMTPGRIGRLELLCLAYQLLLPCGRYPTILQLGLNGLADVSPEEFKSKFLSPTPFKGPDAAGGRGAGSLPANASTSASALTGGNE